MILTLAGAEKFVEKNAQWNWNGWTAEQFIPHDRAVFSPQGAYRNGVWGYLNRYEVNDQGNYEFPNIRTNRYRGKQSQVGTVRAMSRN